MHLSNSSGGQAAPDGVLQIASQDCAPRRHLRCRWQLVAARQCLEDYCGHRRASRGASLKKQRTLLPLQRSCFKAGCAATSASLYLSVAEIIRFDLCLRRGMCSREITSKSFIRLLFLVCSHIRPQHPPPPPPLTVSTGLRPSAASASTSSLRLRMR